MGDKEEIKVNKFFLKNVCEYLEQLKSYKDAEEQGLLLRLPCKVGDTVWYIDDDDDKYPLEFKITKVVIKDDYVLYFGDEKEGDGTIGIIEDDFGKTIFLTEEQAEQALAEMKGETK